MKKLYILFCLCVFATSCKTIVYMDTTGGSKSGGVVELSYNTSWIDIPEVQWEDAQRKAVNTCKDWGYRSAKRFGAGIKDCTGYDEQLGCTDWRIIYKYQCLD